MLTLTCSVTALYRKNDGARYVLEPVASHCAVPGIDEPQGVDLARAHAAVYDREASISPLRLHDLDPMQFEDGGCLIVLGALGWLHFTIFLGVGDQPLLLDLDSSLTSDNLLVSISTDDMFPPWERVALGQWLAGERHAQDLPLSTGKVPTVGLVRRK